MGTSPRHVSQSIYLGKLDGPLGPPGAKQATNPWAKSSSVVLSVFRHVSNTRSATPAISASRAFLYRRTSRWGCRPRAATWPSQSASRSR
ncbi:TPA_asm: UL6.4 sORF 2 [Human alphaherpesvirus 1]|nr:TPA_asm: UL6.4 sORF 2 [Human alphaherpesvirus 1]